MRITPPKKITIYVSIVLAVIGLVIGLIGFIGLLLPAVTWVLVGLLIIFIAWVLLAIGVTMTGI